jgi:predicted membrane protein
MSDFNNKTEESEFKRRRRDGRTWTGIFILIVGFAALLKATLTDFPDWLFSWQMLLIAIGLFIGLRHNFRDITWIILVLIGGIFLMNDIFPEFSFRRYMWPLALIVVGIFIIARPKRGRHLTNWGNITSTSSDDTRIDDGDYSAEDYVESTSIFGGSKKNVLSKKFKGGDLVNIFGGSELDLTQADFTGTAIIDVTTIFGGTKMLVPSNWNVKSEAVTIFGGMDDKRKMLAVHEASDKTLLIRGTVIFGGVEIKSY